MHLSSAFAVALLASLSSALPWDLEVRGNACATNNCLRQVSCTGTQKPGPTSASADCRSMLLTTVTPCATTKTTTITKIATASATTTTVTVSPTIVTTITNVQPYTSAVTTFPLTSQIATTSPVLLTSTVVVTVTQTAAAQAGAKRDEALRLLDIRGNTITSSCTATTKTATSVPTYASSCTDRACYTSACSCIGVTGSTTTAPTPTSTSTVYTTSTSTPVITVTLTRPVTSPVTKTVSTLVPTTVTKVVTTIVTVVPVTSLTRVTVTTVVTATRSSSTTTMSPTSPTTTMSPTSPTTTMTPTNATTTTTSTNPAGPLCTSFLVQAINGTFNGQYIAGTINEPLFFVTDQSNATSWTMVPNGTIFSVDETSYWGATGQYTTVLLYNPAPANPNNTNVPNSVYTPLLCSTASGNVTTPAGLLSCMDSADPNQNLLQTCSDMSNDLYIGEGIMPGDDTCDGVMLNVTCNGFV